MCNSISNIYNANVQYAIIRFVCEYFLKIVFNYKVFCSRLNVRVDAMLYWPESSFEIVDFLFCAQQHSFNSSFLLVKCDVTFAIAK